MLQNFLIISQQVLILFILVAIGFFCGKRKIIDEYSAKHINEVVLYIVTPCVMVSAFQKNFSIELLAKLGIMTFCATGIIAFSILLVHLIFRGEKTENRARVLRFATIFSNCGFMSLPLQDAILGEDGLFYGSVFVAVFNLLVWSYGLVSMSGDIKLLSAKKIIFNPGIMGVMIAFIIFLCRLTLPEIIIQPIKYLANLNTPLPMLIIGFYLSQANLKRAFTDLKAYLAMGLRLLVIPAFSAVVMYFLGVDKTIMIACVIASSAPTAATTTMFSAKFNRDTELSVNIVAATTLLSILTMPIVIAFAQTLTGG